MRVNPLICFAAISLSLIIFFYLTYRNEINSEFKLATKIVDRKTNIDENNLSLDLNQHDNWQILKINIRYKKEIGLLRTLNDKIINSQKFVFFLYKFLGRSVQGRNAILSQNSFASKDFNATNFLSTLFYTKYGQESNDNHMIIIKGKTKKAAKILQIAVDKALKNFYENPENAILSVTDIRALSEKIILLENKSAELVSRINTIKQNNDDNFAAISLSSEINILRDELSKLQDTLKDIQSTESLKINDALLKNDFLRNFGKIEEYVILIQQLTRALNSKPNSPASGEILSNKSKVSALLVREYENAINKLSQDIAVKKKQLDNLAQKSIQETSFRSESNSAIPEIVLYEKVKFSLQNLRNEYNEIIKFWNESIKYISFHSE